MSKCSTFAKVSFEVVFPAVAVHLLGRQPKFKRQARHSHCFWTGFTSFLDSNFENHFGRKILGGH